MVQYQQFSAIWLSDLRTFPSRKTTLIFHPSSSSSFSLLHNPPLYPPPRTPLSLKPPHPAFSSVCSHSGPMEREDYSNQWVGLTYSSSWFFYRVCISLHSCIGHANHYPQKDCNGLGRDSQHFCEPIAGHSPSFTLSRLFVFWVPSWFPVPLS